MTSNFDRLAEWGKRYAERKNKEEAEERLRKEREEAEKKKGKIKIEKEKIVLPSDTQDSFFLGDEFGKEINTKIQNKYGKYEAISKIIYNETKKLILGSNPLYVSAVNEFLPKNIRTATQAELEKILKNNILPIKGQYEDSSLVWRSSQEPNEYLAKDIRAQFKARGITLKENTPYVIPLFTLRLKEDNSSPHKLSFELTDESLKAYFEAPILMGKSGEYINPDDMNENTGLPNKVYDKSFPGNRQLWTRNSGISRLCLGWIFLVSNYDNLSFSFDNGRVVCMRATGTHGVNFSKINSTGNKSK
jgi:hypothetical protein